MSEETELNDRLRKSARTLRAWNWMAAISTRQAEAVAILRDEARFLIKLGLEHPKHARKIGRLIVAYNRLIEAIELRMAHRQKAAA